MRKSKLAIFASGSGTNAENIIQYFSNHAHIAIRKVYTNKAEAGVIKRARSLNVQVKSFSKAEFKNPDGLLADLQREQIDIIILAGFLWLIPGHFLKAYPNRIINIHPSLLPAFGGKGMYGDAVHRAVISNGEWRSGITIHLVNDAYDEGAIIFQKPLLVYSNDTPDSLASRIHSLEYNYYPKVIEKFIKEYKE